MMSEERIDDLYPICFGVSCAFFTIKLLSVCNVEDEKWCKMRDQMLQGGAQMLGLLVWRSQKQWLDEAKERNWKLEIAEKEVAELKRKRCEDAKANERVARIYASQEQNWFAERNRLCQQIGALLNQLRIFDKRRADSVEELTKQKTNLESLLKSNEHMLEQEVKANKELCEELRRLESEADELKAASERCALERASEVWKNKTAFIELVSVQRQLEADLRRALRQVELGKEELAERKYQKHSRRSLWWYKHMNPPSIGSSQTRCHTSEQQEAEAKKIEAVHLRLLSMEVESEQLQARMEALNSDKAELGKVVMKLKELLSSQEAELQSLKNHSASKLSSDKEEKVKTQAQSNRSPEQKTDANKDEAGIVEEAAITDQGMTKKMDIQAMAVFYKIQRLKQQLGILEKVLSKLEVLTAKEDEEEEIEAFLAFMSLLKKQVSKYESLHARIDSVSIRMLDERDPNGKDSRRKTREESKRLESCLQETLHLQRYMVATGQKLTELQFGIRSRFLRVTSELAKISGMDMTRFLESIADLLRQVQSGLDIRSSRIIGDLEGTLASDGILQLGILSQ